METLSSCVHGEQGMQRRDMAERQRREEMAIAAEMERRKNDALRDTKLRQLIREESEELRELQSKLKAAYLNKERAAQVAERELNWEREVVRALRIA